MPDRTAVCEPNAGPTDMTLKLRIDNCDALPDGGPLEYTVNRAGLDFGRDTHLDWTLPDDSRYISGRHCEIRYEKDAYWLYDISRNGTFLNGAQERMKSPYQLENGDKIAVGHYIIVISLPDSEGVFSAEPQHGASVEQHAAPTEDIWSLDFETPAPIDRRDLMPPKQQGRRAADFSEQYIEMPEMRPTPGFPPAAPPGAGVQSPVPPDPFQNPAVETAGNIPFGQGGAPQSPMEEMPGQAAGAPPQTGAMPPLTPAPGQPSQPVDPVQAGLSGEPFAPRPAVPVPPAPGATPLRPQPPTGHTPVQRGATPAAGSANDVLQHIAAGAGVSANCFTGLDAATTGREIGAVLKVVVEELAQLLKARAAAKTMAKSSRRTMLSAMDNNPLKFVPTTEEIIDVMFSHRKAGYLGAEASVAAGFADLKTHEFATYAAMQKALARLLDDFAPESIERKLHASAFSSKNSKAWETYVTRWEAMTEPHENGILDVFLNYFAEAYDEASTSKKP